MRKRILAVFLAASSLACLLCSCGEATPGHGTTSGETPNSSRAQLNEITVGIAQDLDDSLDPYTMADAGTREVMFNVFEGLVKPDSDGNYVCAVASEYTVSGDGLVYTFELRDGVLFHNGAACTTDDVLYSFETCAATSVTSAVVTALSAISDIHAEGSSIVITLSAADPDFISYVSSVYIVPRDYTEQATKPVGTGPFRFVSHSIQENFIIERNDAYYGKAASLSRVTYKIYEDINALYTALNSGALDLAAHISADQADNLSNGYTVLEGTMNLVQALYLNNNVAPFDDILVRQALCYAIDVDEILALTANGHGTKLGSSMYPAFGKYFDPTLADAYPHDVDKAKALLADAGYPDGFSFTIIAPSNYQQHVDTAVVIAEQLKAVNITAEIELVDWSTWVNDTYGNRNFEATVCGFDASTLTASALLGRWVSTSGKNMINYNDHEYDQAFAAAQASTNDAEQTGYYMQCLQILSDTAANVYIQDLADFVAINPQLEGFRFYPMYVMDMSCISYKS